MVEKQLKSITFPGINESYFIPSIDKTLSLEDRAADAKAVGDALANKAPAGYGLGTVSAMIDNPDDVTVAGFFQFVSDKITGVNQNWLMISQVHIPEYMIQTAIHVTEGWELRRIKLNNIWQSWEWVNPPMEVGVEYRTTERYKGKPIYCKAFDIGALPNSTSKIIENFVEVGCNMLRAEGCAAYTGNNETVPIQTISTITLRHDTGALIFATTDNYGSWNGFPVVYYWKGN